jgi:hypothetical protein
MNKEILIYKRVLNKLTVLQNVQVLYSIRKKIQYYVPGIPEIQPAFETFSSDLSILDDFVKKNPKAIETEKIAQKDDERDFTVRAIIAKVQYHYDFAQSDEESEDACRLFYIVEKYKNVAKKEYEAETTLLRNLIDELQQVPDLLNRFCITKLVVKLQRENKEFEALYNARAQTVHDEQLRGNATKYRTTVNKAFDNLCKVITGLQFMPVCKQKKTAIENIIDIINSQIQQATVVYNRHVGVLTAGKKKDEEKETNVE